MAYEFSQRCRTCGGLPHSEICGSQGVRTSPQLIAAFYVLHRLSMPRHPLNALLRLILKKDFSFLSQSHFQSQSNDFKVKSKILEKP